MKITRGQVRAERVRRAGNQEVRREIRNFLQALRSYPTRFSTNHDLSFDEHCRRIDREMKHEERRRA